MAYRYTEEEFALMKKRTDTNLAEFQRNSGRGLPAQTVKEMERAQGRKLNSDGEAVALKNRATPKRKPKTVTAPKPDEPPKIELSHGTLEAQVLKTLEKGGKITEPKAKRGRAVKPAAQLQVKPGVRKQKFNAEPVHYDGIRFDSKLEMRRYKELCLLRAGKAIHYFLRQVPFHLPGGVMARIDFMVVMTNNADGQLEIVYEDTKGVLLQDAKNKYKQIKALYGVEIKLVRKAKG